MGVWLTVVELFLLLPMRSKGVVMQDKTIALAGIAAVTVLAVAGLVLALIAPAQDP
ncbi:MAG TPA: hypothetical protein VHW69_17030 [Rhizomicrobium sp.]|nr:hypothetical protein [Rhizomicrobium sp.]